MRLYHIVLSILESCLKRGTRGDRVFRIGIRTAWPERYVMAQLLESPDVQGIALAQIPREEFRLRGDALALFKEAGSKVLAEP